MEGSKAREHFAVVAARPERLYTGAAVTQRNPDTLGLASAAEDLDRELSRYEALAGRIQHERLDSEKNLHQAAQALSELEQSEGRLAEDSGELARAAQADEFGDLGTQAESLRLQLLSARNKFVLLERRRGSAGDA